MQKKKFDLSRFAGKGYYIALILCAVTIGICGYLYYRNTQSDPSLENPNATVDVMNPDPTDTIPLSKPPIPTLPDPTIPSKLPLATGKPLEGKVLMDYSMDCLCYNPTTRDWRTHDGMDIAAQAGTPVKAAAPGTVYTVFSDGSMGTTVVIRHQDGYVTTYSSLSEDVNVSAGDEVVLGQTIGFAASSALLESALGDHVHFAVTLNGNPMDPEDFWNL